MNIPVKVGLNGFGRIGRYFTRLALNNPNIKIVAINDPAPTKTLVHLFKYDSIHGRMNNAFQIDGDSVSIDGHSIQFTHFKHPSEINWRDQNVDIVLECSGFFLQSDELSIHLHNGAKKVVLSAPSAQDDILNVVLGANDHLLTPDLKIVSNASCTTNSAAPMLEVMRTLCNIQSAYITTVHSYTTDQRLHDSPHKDLRRARAAAQSIVPTTTGAAKALTRIFPDLNDKIGGCGMRVPVPDGSLTDITMVVDNPPTVDEINSAFENASKSNLKSILRYTDEPIVSVDVLGDTNSCIFDSELTSVIGNMVKVVGWYDNEAGYSNRLIDLILKLNALK